MAEGSGTTSGGSAAGASGGESSSQTQAAQAASPAGESTEKTVKAEGGEPGAVDTKAEPEAKPGEKKEQTEQKEETKEEKPPHRYHERLTKAFPDRKFEKAEDYDSALDEHLDSLEGYRERGRKANEKLINLIDSHPEIGSVLRDMQDGATLRQAIARHYDPADFTPEEGEPDYEGWKKNKAEREDKLKRRRDYETQYADNLKVAEKEVVDFAKEHNLDEKAMDEFFDKTQGILDDFNNGKITKDLLLMIKRAFSYEADVKDAREEGIIAGRNEKIVATREQEKEVTGDGLPKLTQSGDIIDSEDPAKENYFAGLRKRMEERGIITRDQ